jgi:uncharacterized membrane protein YfcA
VAADWLLGAVLAFAIATVTAPVGVSGAVFLIPVQISVLETPSPAITPTNLLYNLVAIPGALLRYGREGRLRRRLTRILVVGTLPGVVVGAVVRVELLSGSTAFLFVVAAVLAPLGAWLLAFGPPSVPSEPVAIAECGLTALAAIVGVIGGIYGIGGGSILAPILVGLGFSVVEVAPAALAATFLTSIVGVLAYALLGLQGDGSIAPDWFLGIAMGVGGLGGSYLGAALQPRVPQLLLRRLLGIVALGTALRYLALGAS